jgi:glutamine amidotransferase
MGVAIIKYNAGNIRSVLFALERLGAEAMVTDDHYELRSASHVIFPGVGAANSAMPYLKQRGLDALIQSLTQPFLGICLGMQLMCARSEEGDTDCLGIFDLQVKKFPSTRASHEKVKIPHMGWNKISSLRSPLFNGIADEAYMYFVHSYYAEYGSQAIGTCHYVLPFCAALHHKNFYGVQFHTEKSAAAGERILQNFLSL